MSMPAAIAKNGIPDFQDMVLRLIQAGVDGTMTQQEIIDSIARRLCWLSGNDPDAKQNGEALWQRYREQAREAYEIAAKHVAPDAVRNAGDSGTHLLTPEKVVALRESLGMNQTKFGALIGVEQVHVSDIERGKMEVNDRPIMRLLAVLDLPGVVTRLASIPRTRGK
jgi:DNA-binding transcriptional regulator YiaG